MFMLREYLILWLFFFWGITREKVFYCILWKIILSKGEIIGENVVSLQPEK
jgi:hypothetical protein